MPVTTRFAPSPTGWIHVGNLRTALIGGILAINGKARVLHEAAVEFERIGIDQQLGRIEP